MAAEAPPPPPTIHDHINYAATENNALLKTVSETDYAPAAAEQNKNYIAALTRQIRHKERHVEALASVRMKEKSSHEKYQDSTMRRLAYKMSGKRGEFEQKAAKEERDYFEAVQAEFEASRSLEALQKNLKEAQQTKEEMDMVLVTHQAASEALDKLYASVFDGPTPGFPEEDQAEQEVQSAKQLFNEAQGALSNEKQVVQILERTRQVMNYAISHMDDAESASRADIWGIGGSFADLSERSALARARDAVHQVEQLMQQAQQLSHETSPLGPMAIADGHFMSDMLFDNVFSDYAFHQLIKESTTQVVDASKKLVIETQKAKQRVVRWQGVADERRRTLMQAREKLQTIRRGVFDSVAGGLPEYQP
ncbi:uncharacterized protein BP5553_05565 [Venustampulla echinocandica]|uniref:Uncharacterized protein n=1 Tax=Venustampulla echinocandica TaxID=2656787 RepID=A0A370TRH3_9HELO|nr:uncharacterized protein BP5553_05565 [Venustampulla echinocandica]RDL38132.1 hypothetical protein BP5553_05565 [Venustampulla echinocandica]